MKTYLISVIVIILVVLTSACSPAQPTPLPPTQTPVPTSTSTPVPTWDYVALGDSNPAGYGVGRSYVDIFANYIATDLGVEVRLHNRAFDGAKSIQLLTGLRMDPDLQQDIRDAEVVTIDVGGNDWIPALRAYPDNTCGGTVNQDCLRRLVQSYRENIDGILDEITHLRGQNSKILIRTVDIYMSNCDFFPDTKIFRDKELFNVLKPYTDEFNASIEEATEAHNAKVVSLYLAFNGPDGTQNPAQYLQSDQCHLSSRGHQQVATMLRELGYEN
jgi:lysophospholipase L1-like esterase